jgi:hypothetical protein
MWRAANNGRNEFLPLSLSLSICPHHITSLFRRAEKHAQKNHQSTVVLVTVKAFQKRGNNSCILVSSQS